MRMSRSIDRWRPWFPWIGIAIFAVIQLWALPGDYLGREHDDAHYVLAARSLLHGEYRLGISPGNPPLTFIPPGWPILLTPAAALSGDNPAGYHLTAWILLVLCDVLVWIWLRRRMRPALAFWVVALFALNPLVLARAGKVMTEIPALALILLLSVALDSKKWPGWASGALLGFSWLVRQRATAFVAAVWTWYASKRKWKELIASAVGPAIAVLGWSWWLHRAGATHPELGEWAAAYHESGDFWRAVASNLVYYPRLWGRLWLPYLGAGAGQELAIGLFFGALCVWGLVRLLRRHGPEPALGWLMIGAVMHLIWPWQYDRYLLPFLPMLLWCLLEAVDGMRFRPKIAHAAIGVVLAGQFLGQGIPILSGRYAVQRPELSETYAWIRTTLPPQAVLASPFFSRDALYTGRPFAAFPAASSLEDWVRDLRKERVGYVLIQENADIGLSLGAEAAPALRWKQWRAYLEGGPFKKVYGNSHEGSDVFRLLDVTEITERSH